MPSTSLRPVESTTTGAADFAEELRRVRERTIGIIECCGDEAIKRQHSTLMSPLAWDLAHIAHFEELWLLRTLGGGAPTDPRFDDIYDAFKHDRATRAELPLLSPKQARSFADSVRERTHALVETHDWDDKAPLTRNGFVVGLVAQHELQHQETMLQTMQIAGLPIELGAAARKPTSGQCIVGEVVVVPDSEVIVGATDEPWAYDNELPAHPVEVPEFRIDRYPITNGQWLEFIESGAYVDPYCWSDEGWAWNRAEQAIAPLYWSTTADGWQIDRFGHQTMLCLDEPVQHISWHEAEAFATWAGKRLPTEIEWERAAFGAQPIHDRLASGGPLPIADRGESQVGCMCMLGDVWEWTSSRFAPYPGFRPFPYPEYSEVFFNSDYRVLRGGSWATDTLVARTTFRNWDHPQRRQIFSGVRLAESL